MSPENKKIIQTLTKWISSISVVFTIVVSFLLILNFVQLKTVAPIENNRVEKLIKKLNENPTDIELKKEIRAVDLMARKAFFTSQWQLRLGAYLLLISIILLLTSFTINRSLKTSIFTQEKNDEKINYWSVKSTERSWLIFGVFFIIVCAAILTFLSNNEYSDFNNPDSIALKEKPETKTEKENKNISKASPNTVDTAQTTTSDQSANTENISPEEKDFPDDNTIMKNYPSFRGPFGLGISYSTKIPTEWDGASGKNIAWKVAVPLQGYNSPVIWDNYIFVSGANVQKKEVYCYDRNSGKLLWAKSVDNIQGSSAMPKVTDDTGYSASTLTVDGKRVFAIFTNGDLICFDLKGNRIWAKNIGVPNNHYGHSSSLLFYQNLLIVQYDHSKARNLMALSTHTGEIKWNTTRPGRISWSSPIIVKNNGQSEIILNNDPYIASYEPKTGKEIWKIECLTGEIGASPAYSNGVFFAANAYAKLAAVQGGSSPKILWENNDYLPDVSSPVAWNDILFIPSSAGEIAAYNTKDGSLFWNHEFDNVFYSSPIIADGKIYLIDRIGIMHIMKADKKFELISEAKLGEKTDCTPAFANGKIYIRGQKNLYCIGK